MKFKGVDNGGDEDEDEDEDDNVKGGGDAFIERLMRNLKRVQSKMDDDVAAFHQSFMEAARQTSGKLRPYVKIDKILDVQEEIDELRRNGVQLAAQMVTSSQEMLEDANVQLRNFTKMKNLLKVVQQRHLRAALNQWKWRCSEEAKELEVWPRGVQSSNRRTGGCPPAALVPTSFPVRLGMELSLI